MAKTVYPPENKGLICLKPLSGGLRFFLAVALCLGGWCSPAAAREVAIRPLTITVRVPVYLYLQVGSPGGLVDLVSFKVTALPGSGPVRGESTGEYPVPVRAQGILTSYTVVALTADASQPLSDGVGHQIPFRHIFWKGTGNMPSGRFSGAAQQIILRRPASPGRFRFRGGMAFFYDNRQYFPAGIYRGRVTYTLSAP